MALTENDIDKIAGLARLKLNSQEKQRFLTNLNNILEYMEIIDEIDMESSEEMQHVLSQPTPFRDDIAKPGLACEEILPDAH